MKNASPAKIMTTRQIMCAMKFQVRDLDNPVTILTIAQLFEDEDRSRNYDILSQIDASRLIFEYN